MPHSTQRSATQLWHDSKVKCIRDIYRGAMPTKKRLRTYGITPDRVDEIVAARQADEARDWSVVRELSLNGPVNVHDFCQWLFHNVESQNGATRRNAYGHWNPNDCTIRKPPRGGAVYFMLSIFFGDGDCVDGKYGSWENDIRPALNELDELVQCRINCGGIDRVERPLQWLSVALREACCFEHEGDCKQCYQRLQDTRITSEWCAKIRRWDEKDERVVLPWDTLVERVRETFGPLSREWMYIELFTHFPARDDLSCLAINPSNEDGNFIRLHEDGGEFVKSSYKTRNKYGIRTHSMCDELCTSIREYMHEHALVDGDFLLGRGKHSAWVGRFLTEIGVKTDDWKGFNICLLRHMWLSNMRAIIKEKCTCPKQRVKHGLECLSLMDHSPAAAYQYVNQIKSA